MNPYKFWGVFYGLAYTNDKTSHYNNFSLYWKYMVIKQIEFKCAYMILVPFKFIFIHYCMYCLDINK